MDIYLARQPIFNRKKRLYAYEILYRGNFENVFPENVDSEVATSRVLAHSLFNVGLDQLTGGKKALINFTEKHLLEKTPSQLPVKNFIVEILEDVSVSDGVLDACRELKTRGYTLALDDYSFDTNFAPLLEFIDIIKIDIRAINLNELSEKVSQLKQVKKFKFLAEKIEDNVEFANCFELGFDFFQGFFFSKPEVLQQKKLDASKVALLALMAEVNKKEFSFPRVERMLTADVALSYKLLRYINSAYYSLVSKVKSIKHALTYLGEKGARQFICLAVASEMATGKTSELAKLAIIRAQLCKLLAVNSQGKHDESLVFLLGLFSLLDSMLDMPMVDLLEKLPLADELKEALAEKTGPFADYINAVLFYEQGELSQCESCLTALGLTPDTMVSLYYEALQWADLFIE